MHAISRGIIWSVESQPHSNNWEQYSYRLNGLIEDARARERAHVRSTVFSVLRILILSYID